MYNNSVLRSRCSRNYLGRGIKFLTKIFCSQFGGCYDEEKLFSSSFSTFSTTVLEQFEVPIYGCS